MLGAFVGPDRSTFPWWQDTTSRFSPLDAVVTIIIGAHLSGALTGRAAGPGGLTRPPPPAPAARASGASAAARLVFSANTFAAALLALYIGFSLGLPRPHWGMATTYIVSQPLAGALRSTGVYRLIGTVVGGAAAVALVSPLADAPEVLSLALALWVGLCLYLSLLDRTPRSYVFILAGYTAAIIGFP